MQKIIDAEREKAQQALPDMLEYLSKHPSRHTPFFDRWFSLCVDLGTMVYPAKIRESAEPKAGRRVRHGKPERVVEVIESAERFDKPGVWFVRVVA